MIPKKINRKNKGTSKLRSIVNLINYIHAPSTRNHEEKLMFAGTRGFVFDDFETQKQEMLTLAHSNTRSPNPVMHYLFSWRESEQPTKEQMEELVDIFIEETGLDNHQIFWGAHKNTKNIHIHLAVNKIDKDSEQITRINNNLDIEILHKIVARVEQKQGWEATEHSRYTCDDEGNIMRNYEAKSTQSITQEAASFERAHGEKSAIRLAKENILPLLDNIKSWQELYHKFDDFDMRYNKKGSGALIFVGDIAVKASSVSRQLSLKNMEKKLGNFEERIEEKKEKNNERQRDKQERQEPSIKLAQILSEGRMHRMPQCPLVHRGARKFQRSHRKKHRRREIEALLPSLAGVYHKINNFMRWHGSRALSYTHIDLWFKYQHEKMKAYQEKILAKMRENLGLQSDKNKGIPRFVDWLKVNDFSSQLDEWRYERNHNIIDTSTLQRQQKMKELQGFLAYDKAIQADKYRITCIKISEDGEKKAFILDKQYQVNGFNSEALQARIEEMKKIQAKGNNIYITPLSEHKHHILLDDMTSDTLQDFLADGFQPCTIIESSPNNYQALLTIQKLDSQYDRNIANKLTERLNKKYGDKNLSGCIHPHRFPGFENQKPKHRQEDGTFPLVKIIKAEQVECSKAYRLSKQLHTECLVSENKRIEQGDKIISSYTQVASHTAYYKHLENIKKHFPHADNSRIDSMIALRMRATGHSKVSIEQTLKNCAPQWRMSGQDGHKIENRNWNDYAHRTAEYAFSYAGDRDLAKNEHLHDFWKNLELGQEARKRVKLRG